MRRAKRGGSIIPAGQARTTALLIGGMRVGVGAGFLAAPVTSIRMLGVDTATASRVTFLARMAAARDGALGVGTVWATLRGRGAAGWLLAGAFCDATDAIVIGAAASRRRLDPLRAGAVAASAVGAAGIGAAAAASLSR